MKKIKKPVALVTGATGCIGSAIAKKMIEDGFFVIGIGKDKSRGVDMSHEMGENNFKFYSIDVSSNKKVLSLFEENFLKINHPELVITCAGILEMGNTNCFSAENWNKVIETNLTGTFYFLRESLRLMKIYNKGTIISIGSRWGISGAKNAAAYSASKSALRALIKSIQLECMDTEIKCVLVSPGSVTSDMSDQVNNNIKDRLLDADDIANLVAYIVKTPSHMVFDEIVVRSFPYDFLN